MLTPKELASFNGKRLSISCHDGYSISGKCYVYSELDDDDEDLIFCVRIGSVMVYLEDIKEIREI